MRRSVGRWVLAAAMFQLLAGVRVQAAVTGVSGSTKARVMQFFGVFPIQSDFNQEIVPTTTSQPPAIARARLDRLLPDDSITAAGQALAQLDQPNLTGIGGPNDAGLDLGAFSDDLFTGWFVEGQVTETRTLQLGLSEVGSENLTGTTARVRSRVLLSGAMLITAAEADRDLTGSRVTLSFSVVLKQDPRPEQAVLSGAVTLVGGPDGAAQVESPTGALAGMFLPIVEFSDQLQELPLVRMLPFAGVNLPYEYDITVDQPFQLTMDVRAQVFTSPDGIGAAAVFGAPQEGLASVLARIKGDDRGQKLADAISRQVDTTGQAYANTPVDAPASLSSYFPMCGVMGIESTGLAMAGGLLAMARIGANARRIRRRCHSTDAGAPTAPPDEQE